MKRWTLPAAGLLLAAIAVLPPLVSLNRFHRRIADSISDGIGRPVRMSSVHMRLLPRPGFEITDFVVEEDPAFGAEPILRASEVTAYVRLLSLWRGRLEIARIAFDEPSVNLARNGAGRWNFDSLVSQAAQIPKAPTGQTHAGGLQRFPYIDASNARMNFKIGDEKMPFSFFNADLAVWLENPGEWRVEFAGQPARTDLSVDLANTGIVKINGSLRRASTVTQMPAVLHAEWSNAPLGQLSRLLVGADADWRGDLDLAADVTGSADQAIVKVLAKGRGIHREEFQPREPLDMDVACQMQFTRLGRSFDAITCLTPTGDGHLLLTGSAHAIAARFDPALSLEVNNMPVAMALDGLRLVRSGFAPTALATGRVDGNFTYAASAASPTPQLHGRATVIGAKIALPSLKKPLALPPLHFTMNIDAAIPKRQAGLRHRSEPASMAEQPALLLEPFAVDRPGSLSISGSFSRSGFGVHAEGETSVEQAMALGTELRLVRNHSVAFAAKGTAYADLTVRGAWVTPIADPEHPVPPVSLEGSLGIHNAEVTGNYLAQPLEIVSAQALFRDNQTSWTASSMMYGPIHADGSLSYPVFCQSATGCAPHFALHFASLDAAAAQVALLGASHHGELVQELIARFGSDKRAWPTMTGSVAIGTLTIGNLAVRDVDAAVNIEGNAVEIESLAGKALDGELGLTGTIAAPGNAPQYQLNIKLDRATAASIAGLFDEKWGSGIVNLTTDVKFSGFKAEELLSSAAGTFQWNWSKGGLPTPSGASDLLGQSKAPFALAHFDIWSADGTIAKNVLTLEKSEVENRKSTAPVSGTISFARELDLTQPPISGMGMVKITGTLQEPEVRKTPTAETAEAAR